MQRLLKLTLFLFFFLSIFKNIMACEADLKSLSPCLVISKTPNTSYYNEDVVKKIIITKQEIDETGSTDVNDTLKLINGLDIFQSGSKGQTSSIFTRGSESNHTLALLNGIPINDQSVTNGLHDFGQDFIQTFQQIEIFKGPSGAHFGPSAIGGAINFVTGVDYTNYFSLTGFNAKNYYLNTNNFQITDNDWHLNFNNSIAGSKTNSAISGGNEDDGVKNIQVNFNGVKWIDENLKLKSSLYARKTKSEYDGSSTDEEGYLSDNRFYALQSIIQKNLKNSEIDLILHYHNYDREYNDGGYLDEYNSKSLLTKFEKKLKYNNKISIGYGGEYKYDWGNFENRGDYKASTRGNTNDFGIFTNYGLKLDKNKSLSVYLRSDNHNTAGNTKAYKISFAQKFNNLKIIGTHSTGSRNPTLYELFGSDNYGIKGNLGLKSEKSSTNEVSLSYDFNNDIRFNITGYKTEISDRIESNSAYTHYENKKSNSNQKGLENEFSITKKNQSLKIFSNFNKSRKENGQAQNRRPDLSFGAKYKKKIYENLSEELNFILNYKYTGKYTDWDGTKNSKQKDVNLVDVSINKSNKNKMISLSITNLLNTSYEKPATYNQNKRQLMLMLKKLY